MLTSHRDHRYLCVTGADVRLEIHPSKAARREAQQVLPVDGVSNGNGRPRGESPQVAAHAVIVVDRAVHDAPVVPHRQRAGFPVHAARELGPRHMVDQLQRVEPGYRHVFGHRGASQAYQGPAS